MPLNLLSNRIKCINDAFLIVNKLYCRFVHYSCFFGHFFSVCLQFELNLDQHESFLLPLILTQLYIISEWIVLFFVFLNMYYKDARGYWAKNRTVE